jgi:carbon starvation protein
LSGTFTYLWQLFGGANQLMASLALMLVVLWLVSEKKNPTYAFWPMLFMYVTTIAANLITAYNLWVIVFLKNLGKPGIEFAVVGAAVMIIIALFLVAAALYIGYDALQAYNRMKSAKAAAAPAK